MGLQTVSVSIAGVTKKVNGLRCAKVINGVGPASFNADSTSTPYIPADGDAVVVTVGGSPYWSGRVVDGEHTWKTEQGGTASGVTAHDGNALLRDALSNTIFPGGTLKALLQTLTNLGGNWRDVGLTLDAGQATGPTLGQVTAAWSQGDALAKYIADLSGYAYRVNASNAIKYWAPGSVSSGVTLSRANGNVREVRWRRNRFEYKNRIWVIYGPNEVRQVTESWNGNGSARDFAAEYQVAAAPGAMTRTDGVTTVTEPVGTYGVDVTMEWTWDPSYGTYGGLRQKATSTPLSAAWLLSLDHASQFPNYVFVDDPAEVGTRGQVNRPLTRTDIVDLDEARAAGLAAIRQSIPRPKAVHIVTGVDGIEPGATVVVDLPEIDLSATVLVQAVEASFAEKAGTQVDVEYTLTCVASDELVPTAQALWQRLVGGSVGGASGGSVSGGGGVTTIITGTRSHVWGGSRSRFVYSGSYTPVEDYLDFVATADGDVTVRVEVMTDNAGTSVTPRIYDVTAAAAAVTGSASTATSWAEQFLTFTAVAGHRYRLQIAGSNATNGIRGVGVS